MANQLAYLFGTEMHLALPRKSLPVDIILAEQKKWSVAWSAGAQSISNVVLPSGPKKVFDVDTDTVLNYPGGIRSLMSYRTHCGCHVETFPCARSECGIFVVKFVAEKSSSAPKTVVGCRAINFIIKYVRIVRCWNAVDLSEVKWKFLFSLAIKYISFIMASIDRKHAERSSDASFQYSTNKIYIFRPTLFDIRFRRWILAHELFLDSVGAAISRIVDHHWLPFRWQNGHVR